jgi:chitodextrinase
MLKGSSAVSRYRRALAIVVSLLIFFSAQVAAADTINGHTVVLDSSGKIIPWTADPSLGYDTVVNLAWDYLLNRVPNDTTGKPAYFTRSYLVPDTQQLANWPHNPAGLYGMLTESALKYYQYSGNRAVVTVAENVAAWHLQNGMTPANYSWANVPYSSADAGSLTYQGASYGNTSGVGDGTGYLEPDKIGELGYAWLTLYQFDGNTAFRDAAINSANVLAAKIRTGSSTQSPWPFRVNAQTGAIREDYSADVIGPIRLFDLLIKLNLGDTATYQTARQTAWNWLMTFPMQNNVWANYFEDVVIQTNLANVTQYSAVMTARYLMEHPEFDANWQAHVRGILNWVKTSWSTPAYGATTVLEQREFMYAIGSHTSRYAAANAMLYELTGDTTAQQEAIRSFNWATYMARSTGVVIDGPAVNNQWFTDGYGDYVRHFMTGMGAMPTLAPAGQNHLLRSTSIVQNVTYATGDIRYTTFDAGATEVLRVNFVPGSVWAGGTQLPVRGDLLQEGWTFDQNTGTLRIRHDNSGSVQVLSGGSAVNFPPTVNLTAPTQGANYQPPANITLTASPNDSDGTIARVDFYNGSTLLGTSVAAPYSYAWNNVPAGTYTLSAVAFDNLGASGSSSGVTITVNAVSSLPSPWQTADIGSVGVVGSASYSNGTFSVSGSGAGITGSADSFRFVYQPISGDAEIIAQVTGVQNNVSGSLAGVMIRNGLTAGTREASVGVTAGSGLTYRRRTSTNGSTTAVSGGSGTAPYFVRLRRQGSTFTAFQSSDGSSWTQIGQNTISMSTTVYVGLVVTSSQNTGLNSSTFAYVNAGSSVDSTPPVISNVSTTPVQNSVNVDWTTNEAADTQVEYGATSSYGQSTALDGTLATSHSQFISGLVAGNTYHFRVRSRDAAGNLGLSGDLSVTIAAPADTTKPTAPTNLVASAGSSTLVNLAWTASTDNVGVTRYNVLRNGVQIGTSTGVSYPDATVAPNISYSYVVNAQDAAGNVSANSNTATVTTPPDTTKPSAPAGLTGSSNTSGTQITLSWTAATDNVGVTGYQVWRNGALLGTAPNTSYADATVVAGTTYNYTVRATDAAGNVSVDSNTLTITATAPPPTDTTPPTAPASLNGSANGSTRVDLNWSASTDNVGVVGYQIWRNSAQIGTSTTLNYSDTTVQASTTYTYTVRAYDAAGNTSQDSPSVPVTTPAPSSITIASIGTTQQGTNATTISSPAFSTTAANTLLVAFIATDGPSGSAQTITTVTGGGLTWTLRKRVNVQAGSSEIWQAVAPNVLSNITVTATRSSGGYQGMITVVGFQGASTVTAGATGGANSTSGTPSASLVTTKANSQVWGVGNDWDHATARTVGTGQTKVSEFLAPAADTFWVQRLTNPVPASGTTVTVNDTAPNSDRWNIATIEIPAQ